MVGDDPTGAQDEVVRSLRRRRANLIGLAVSTIENRFSIEVSPAAEQATHEQGYPCAGAGVRRRLAAIHRPGGVRL